MSTLANFIRRETVAGKTVEAGSFRVTPISQAISLRWPHGGWVWNRPIAIHVENGGREETIPIVDVNRAALWGMAGIAAALAVFMAIIRLGRKK